MSKNYTFLLKVTVLADNHSSAEQLLYSNIKSKLPTDKHGLIGIIQLE